MLDALYRVCNNTKKLNVNKITHSAFDNSLIQHEIVELNQQQLYDEGVFSDGSPTGNYAPNTIEGTKQYLGKKQKGQRYDHKTFKDSGALYNTIRVQNKAKEIDLIGNTVKDGVDIEESEGKPIVGLTDKSIGETRELVLPIIRDKTLQNILKK